MQRASYFNPPPRASMRSFLWLEWWRSLFEYPFDTLYILCEQDNLHVRVRRGQHAVEVATLDLNCSSSQTALRVLFHEHHVDSILKKQGLKSSFGSTILHDSHGHTHSFQYCPHNKPETHEFYIGGQRNSAPLLKTLNFDSDLLDELMRVSGGDKIFVSTGSFGGGKEILLGAVSRQLQSQQPNDSAFFQFYESCISIAQMNTYQFENYSLDVKSIFSTALQSNPSLVVVDQLASKDAAQVLLDEIEKGTKILTTLTSGSDTVLERLDDFFPGLDWGGAVGGWAACYRFFELCVHCSTSHEHHERRRGLGCSLCQGFGVGKVRLVVDLWEVVDRVPRQLFCAKQQALTLVTAGIVERQNAYDVLGHLQNHRCSLEGCPQSLGMMV